MIAALVLAAGASTRMGRPKLLLPLPGGTLLSTVASRLLAAPVDRVVVVLGCGAQTVRDEAGLPDDPRLVVVENESWGEGMASSIRRGLDECGDAEAVLIALGDQPSVDPAVVAALIAAARGGARLAVPVRGDRTGHPVLFARSLFDELKALAGDVGAREVVRRHRSEAALVPVEALPGDIDTEEDYRAFLEAG